MSKVITNDFVEAMSPVEKRSLLYAEHCAVKYSGLLVGELLDASHLAALTKFKELGVIDFGGIPAALLPTKPTQRKATHWVTLHDQAWLIAHQLRRIEAKRVGALRQEIDAAIYRIAEWERAHA